MPVIVDFPLIAVRIPAKTLRIVIVGMLVQWSPSLPPPEHFLSTTKRLPRPHFCQKCRMLFSDGHNSLSLHNINNNLYNTIKCYSNLSSRHRMQLLYPKLWQLIYKRLSKWPTKRCENLR